MNQSISEYSKERFLSLLKELYSATFDQNGFNIKFPNHTNKAICSELAYSEHQFSKSLQPRFTGSYEIVIKSLEKEKELREQRQKIKAFEKRKDFQRWRMLLAFLTGCLIAGVVFGATGFFNIKVEKELNILSTDGIENLLYLTGDRNMNRFIWEFALINNRVKESKLPISSADSLNYVREVKRTIVDVVIKQRIKVRNFDYSTEWGENVYSIMEKFSPSDSLFKCTDSELTFAKKLPVYATPFDRSLKEAKDIFLNKDISTEKLSLEVGELSSRVILKLTSAVSKYLDMKEREFREGNVG